MNNLLCEISFPVSGTDRTAIYQQLYGSNQYVAKLKKGTELVEAMSLDGSFEIPGITLVLDDSDRYYRQKLITINREHIANIQVVLRDEAGTIKYTGKIESWLPTGNDFTVRVSPKIDMKKDFTSKITTAIWANAATEAIGQVIPKVYNTYARVKAWLVNNVAGSYDWLLGSKTISTVTRVEANGVVVDAAFYSLSNDGTYWWLNLTHGAVVGQPAGYPKFVWCDVTTPAYTPLQIITDIASPVATIAANVDFATWLSNQGYSSSKVHFYLDREMAAEEALKIFCDSFACNWRINSSNQIIFEWINRSSITIDKLFKGWPFGGDMLAEPEFQQISDYKPTEIINEIKYFYDRNPQDGDYNSNATYNGADQSDGVFHKEYEFEYLNEATQSAVTAGELYELNKEPGNKYEFGTTWDIGNTINPGGKIQAWHWNALTNTPMFGIITAKRVLPVENKIIFEYSEKNYLYSWYFLLTEDGKPILTEAGYPIVVE